MKEIKFSTLFRMSMIIRLMAVLPLLAMAIGLMVMMYQIAHPYQVVTTTDFHKIDTTYSFNEAKTWNTGDTLFGIYKKVDSKTAFYGRLPLDEQKTLVKLTTERDTALVYADSINKYSISRNFILSIKKL